MRVAMLVAVLGLAGLAMPTPSPSWAAEAQVAADFPVSELMQATALDLIFDQFGAAIAASARVSDISTDEIFLSHWEAAAASSFNGAALRTRLASTLDGKFSADERAALGEFFRSDFGHQISSLERAVAKLSVEDQVAALSEGGALSDEAGAVRSTQLDDLMELMSAEISGVMAGESMRALLLGMSVSHQHGDIEVPWQEIDAQVEAMMPSLLADHTRAQRAMMAYAYRTLTDDELERYITFLRTPPAQKLYGIAAYAVGQIVARSMSSFGETLAARMASVNI
jgi:tellurite resistance protein